MLKNIKLLLICLLCSGASAYAQTTAVAINEDPKTAEEFKVYTASVKTLHEQEWALSKQEENAADAERTTLNLKINAIKEQIDKKTAEFVTGHPGSAYSIKLITEMTFMGEYSEAAPLYEKLNAKAKQTADGQKIAERLKVMKRSAVGMQVLDFTQNNTEGKPVKINDFKGKYVLIDFWASWCHPCRAENPNVLKAYNRYKDKNFTVVGVSLDDKAENWKKAILDDNMPWTQLSDLKGWKNEVSTYYGINGIPSTLLIGPDGKIIAKNLRGRSLDKKLEELFGKAI